MGLRFNKPLKIDKHVKIPTPKVGQPHLYPFNTMKVGDSFFSLCVERKIPQRQANIINAMKSRKLKGGLKGKFTTRRVKGGIRCWRIR